MAEETSEQGTAETAAGSAPARTPAKASRLLASSARRAVTRGRRVLSHVSESVRLAAGPAFAGAAAGLRQASQSGAAAIEALYRQRLQPLAQRSGRWLGRRLHPRSLVRDYRRILLLAHRLGPDRAIERLCFVSTAEHIPLAIVRVPHQLRRTGHDYRPSPRLVFEWALAALPEPAKHYRFIDYGAGRGRVLLMASHHPFEKITGVEIAEELYRDCLLNIAQYPRSLMKCRDVDCFHVSAMRLDIPEEEAVFYFNNPFDRSMAERVAGQIVRAYKEAPRRFYVICVDMHMDDLFEDTGVFEPVPVPLRQRLKIAAFSPYRIALYRTVR